MYGFYFELHGSQTIDGYKARHKKFREDFHPSVSLHAAVGGSALIGEAGVVFRLHPRANRADLVEQIATKLKKCKQDTNTLALRNKANSEAPFSGFVPPFSFTTRKVHYKPDRSTRSDQWPSVDVLQFVVHPAHVQFMSALILSSVAQNPNTLMRGKYYVPRYREGSSGLADLCLNQKDFIGRYTEVSLRDIPEGALDIVIPDLNRVSGTTLFRTLAIMSPDMPDLQTQKSLQCMRRPKQLQPHFLCTSFRLCGHMFVPSARLLRKRIRTCRIWRPLRQEQPLTRLQQMHARQST